MNNSVNSEVLYQFITTVVAIFFLVFSMHGQNGSVMNGENRCIDLQFSTDQSQPVLYKNMHICSCHDHPVGPKVVNTSFIYIFGKRGFSLDQLIMPMLVV